VAGAVAVDSQGAVYITGTMHSANLATTQGAAQATVADSFNAFVASYTADGTIRWLTYLGGSGNDAATGIAVDGQNNVYVTGYTESSDFPVTPGAFQQHDTNSKSDAFLVSYDTNGKSRWATYLGGEGADVANAVAADGQGNVYVTGKTDSRNFPVTTGALQPRFGDPKTAADNAFVARFDMKGDLDWATYLGGPDNSEGDGIAVGQPGDIYLVGTGSGAFPVTPGAEQTIYGGAVGDAFVARLLIPTYRPAALDPVAVPASSAHTRFFTQTHHALEGSMLAFWDRLGGITTLGLPLSEPFALAGARVQATERAILQLNPDRNEVRLLPLGQMLTAARTFAPVPPATASNTLLYFPDTGHTLTGAFLVYWRAHAGSILLGAPISQPDREGLGNGTGKAYTVQWFLNGRLEMHPEVKNLLYRVEQGRVGYEYLYRLGLL
jgi:Beta-propeller repeat